METFSFEATGTHWEISVPKEFISNQLINEVKNFIEVFESTYSRFRKDSLINKLSNNVGTFELPEEAKTLFDTYYEFTKLTKGSFTPFIGKTLNESGYDSEYSFKSKNITLVDTWDEIIDYNFPNITIKKPTQMDFGAAGKGYIMDLVGQLLEQHNIYHYCIDAGHDILYKDRNNDKPLRIGLEHPLDTTKVIGVANVLNASICGSSGNRRNWGKFHHIIDAQTLESPKKILSTWIIAKEAILADALSTSLFFVSPDTFITKYEFEYLILYNDLTLSKSKAFPGEIFNA
jgi:FAD:protein FMN transferase